MSAVLVPSGQTAAVVTEAVEDLAAQETLCVLDESSVSESHNRCFLRSRCARWKCGVLTTWGGTAGIGLGHLLGREHDSIPQGGVEAPRLSERSLTRMDYCCCC